MPPAESPPDRLDSWKEIANYLDRQVRTVQRWEKEEGLPVHRLPHKKQGSVYAFRAELDLWRNRHQELGQVLLDAAAPAPPAREAPPAPLAPPQADSPPRPRVRPRSGIWTAAAALTAVAGGLAWFARPATPPLPSPPPPLAGRLFARATSSGAQPRLIPLGHRPNLIAITPDGATVVVTEPQVGALALVDAATEKLRQTLVLGGSPVALALAPDSHTLYVGDGDASRLAIVDLASGQVRSLATAGAVSDEALTADGRYLYLAMQYSGLARLDTRTLALDPLTSPACPAYLALGPQDQRLYIAYQCGGLGGRSGHDAVGVMDLAGQHFVARLVGPPQVGTSLAVSFDGNQIWVGMGDACSAPQYDHVGCQRVPSVGANLYSLGENRLIQTIWQPPALGLEHITFLPDRERVALGGNSIDVVDISRLAVLEHLSEPTSGSIAFAATPLRSPRRAPLRAFVPLLDANALAVYDAAPPGCEPPSAGLLDWWPGDGSAADAWGLEQGHESAGASYAPGRVGQAFALRGAGSQASFGHDSRLSPVTGFSVAAWLQLPRRPRPAVVIGKMDRQRGWQLRQQPDGRLALWLGGRAVLTTPQPLAGGSWHHVALSLRAQGLSSLDVDGALAAQAHFDLRPAFAPNADLVLGGNPDPAWHALIDEVVFYDQALTPAQIAALVRMPACMDIP